jgi:carbon starvation protein
VTIVLGVGMGLTGYINIWPLFGASNQLLAAVGLLAVATWLGKVGKNNKMFYIPMVFMLCVTVTSLIQTAIKNIKVMTGGVTADFGWSLARTVIAVLLVVLALILAADSIRTMIKNAKEKKNASVSAAASAVD